VTCSENLIIKDLKQLCAGRPLDEKWLLAPTVRVGTQWLDSVAWSGQPVLNARVRTIKRFALDIAAPLMAEGDLALLPEKGMHAQLLVGRLFGGLADPSRGYLSGLTPSPGLNQALSGAVLDLRMAGLAAQELQEPDFEVSAKGTEIKDLLSGYERQLKDGCLLDYAGAISLAVERLEKEPSALGDSSVVVIAGFQLDELWGLEKLLWGAIPENNRLVLDCDEPAQTTGQPASNRALLSFVAAPAQAPTPGAFDGTVRIFRAIGEVNEVREVLRRCVENGIPFDDVEVLHTDASTYVPLIYELCCRLRPGGQANAPVTFEEGIPSHYFRPARALLGWLAWMAEGFSQPVLVRMVTEGLLAVDEVDEKEISYSRLGAILRSVPIGGMPDRYLPAIDRETAFLRRRVEAGESTPQSEDQDEIETPRQHEEHLDNLDRRVRGLAALRALVSDLLEIAPRPGCDQRSFLNAAATFLDRRARGADELDRYCHKRLSEEITELAEALAEGDVPGFAPAIWLSTLTASSSIEGKGPRPGCLYVAPLRGGGHSGRGHTFIIGLDDARFPGAGTQDPILLDAERGRISQELPTGARRLQGEVDDLARLLAGLRGNVTLGYCCRSLSDDREMFPSPALISAYRILDKRQGDHADFLRWVGEPASFAPEDRVRCIDATEWWLSRMCGEASIVDAEAAIADAFSNLERGLAASAARGSDFFTEYDGYVPQAGSACDPESPTGHVLSASRLETMGRCPLEYFFRYVLGVEPLEEYLMDPGVWLDQGQMGVLLHSAYNTFMTGIAEKGLRPVLARDEPLLQAIIDAEISRWEELRAPPSPAVLERDRGVLYRAAHIFLSEEQQHCLASRPAFFEVSVGLQPDSGGTPLDRSEPVAFELPDGRVVRVYGRIDRVDELPPEGSGCYAVWDYKTGSSRRYNLSDPFNQGRFMQGAIYLELASQALSTIDSGARVERFGYFFPSSAAHGDRLDWQAHELEHGRLIIARLCRMIAGGCFPFTNDPGDVRYSDYRTAFGDVEARAADTARKLANPANRELQPFRELREVCV
jgi:RecB family exonuclease